MEKLLKLRDEMKEDLLHGSIFPFWEQYTIDHENGGFYGAVTVDKVIHKDASKGLVLNAPFAVDICGRVPHFRRREV